MTYTHKTGYKYLTKLLSGIATDNMEQSIKISGQGISDNRFLAGISTNNLDFPACEALFREMGLPKDGLQILKEHYCRASSLLFGYESPKNNSVILKIYLEFWNYVSRKVALSPIAENLELMHLGVKWNPESPDKFHLTQYKCHPMISLRKMQKWIQHNIQNESGIITDKILNIVGHLSGDQGYVFLEVGETNNNRRSIDINLYKAGLFVSDIRFPIMEYLEICGIEKPELLLEEYLKYPLGHISAGYGRNNEDFMTIYFEIDQDN